jgi:hypothetical protein
MNERPSPARTALCVGLVGLFLVVAASAGIAEEGPDAADQPTTDAVQQLAAEIQQLKQRLTELEETLRRLQEAKEKEELEEATAMAKTPAVGVDELEELRRLAEAEGMKEEQDGTEEEETTFTAKGLSLQALNPEFSVTGDMHAFYRDQERTRERFGFEFRNLGLHLESYLDPYTRFKAAVEINENGAELGEAYMTRYGLLDGVNLTFGKFRQQFGVVNRWHKHGLDQFDFPLALRQIFGNGGLNQTGVSLDWVLPRVGKTSQDLTIELTNGKSPRLFSGNTLGTPSFLLHYKNYRDISKDTYFEVGLSGVVGWRDEWVVDTGGVIVTEHCKLPTLVYGMDLNLLWEPTERMRYRNLVWRTELYVLNRDIVAPDGSGRDTIDAWGAYSYVQSKINRTLEIGVRLDYYEPDARDYVGPDSWLIPHAFPVNVTQWQVVPYVTRQQSPWVRWRFEYEHMDPGDISQPEDIIYLQLIFAAGPHKHERY